MQFHHAGIATDDIDGLVDLYGRLFDAPVVHREQFDGMTVVFLELEDGFFELLEAHDGGPIERYLEAHGPGIHHLAFEAADIEAALATARDCGVELIDAEPRPGAWGHDVAFLHPAATGGVLLEFVDR